MHPNSRFKFVTRLLMPLVVIASLATAGCKNDSVVSNDAGQSTQAGATPSPAADGAANPAAVPGASPMLPPGSVPTTPVGPIGQTTAQGTPSGERQEIRGGIPVTVSSAKPMLTPAPDPFPARPTPTVVMAEGKIVQQWRAAPEAARLVNPFKNTVEAAKLGREFYMQKCVDCHGKEGRGNGYMGQALKRDGKPLPPTNLASKMVQANSDGELFWKITNGRSPMPAHRVRFEDEQRWQIVAFLRTLKE
ncbi:MAG: c-type cytochrome [Blastocatellia bacterium]